MPQWSVDMRFDFITQSRLPLMWCLIAFILTFCITRAIVRYIRATAEDTAPKKWWQPRNLSLGGGKGDGKGDGKGFHLHHVVFGVLLVLISGVAMVTLAVDGGVGAFTTAAIFFGIGAALVLDEFALILHLQDVYWSEDGRTSVDAVFIAVAVAGLLMLGFNPLAFFDIDIWRADDSWVVRAAVIGWAVASLALALVVLAKGKVWTGLLGMGVPPLLVIGAVRLSRPHAPWARWRYLDHPHKMDRALQRERRIRRPLVRANLWLQSALAGMPRLPDDTAIDATLDRQVHPAPAPISAATG
ncbi:membrane protein [Mycolicibacterium chitae]|uniref:Integral membrane protein n=2 Tax=Mycolicibacterium chitae TaxID=1792 RepID=A0A3S4VHF1_MYCCI|nr:membrane protein [Mycolicibacterium chitae]VEG47667.1 integral membrane protein [Mycolicibacterium chitae]